MSAQQMVLGLRGLMRHHPDRDSASEAIRFGLAYIQPRTQKKASENKTAVEEHYKTTSLAPSNRRRSSGVSLLLHRAALRHPCSCQLGFGKEI